MRKRTVPVPALIMWLGLVGAACAQEATAPEQPDANAARWEALLQKQQQEIDALKQQVALANQQNTDAARIDAMRQQIREILSEEEFRESLMPTLTQAGYDNGFFIRSTDDKFLIRFKGLFQFRWTYYEAQHRNRYLLPNTERQDRTGFDLNRVRFRLEGQVYSPDLTYALELESDSPDAYDEVLSEAWVNYRFADEFQFKAGFFRPASTRMQMMDNSLMQFPDRGMVDAVMGHGYGIGARLWGLLAQKRLEYYLDVLNSVADGETFATGRVITVDPPELDTNPAILFRTVWHALAEDVGNDFAADADLPRHTKPVLDFGFHYLFNQDNGDLLTTRVPFPRESLLPGGFGLTTTNGMQVNEFGLDSAFKYCGFSTTGEYILRILDPTSAGSTPFTPWWLLTGDSSTVAQHGAYVQSGYFLPIPGFENKLEVVARVGGISTLAEETEGSWEYAGGLNYYIQGNKVKLQADVTKVSEVPISAPYSSLANVNDEALIFRVQLQVAF